MRRQKAESIPRLSMGPIPKFAPPPRPKPKEGEPGWRGPVKTPPIKPSSALRMEAVPMPKPTRPKEGAAPVPEPAGEPKSSSETAAVTLTSAAKRPAKKGMPKGGGSSRGRLVYRPKKVVTKKAEEEEPSATGEPGVADEAPLPKTGANRGPEHQSRELCRGHRWSQRGSKLNPPDDDDDGLETTWEEENEEEKVREENVPVEPETPRTWSLVGRFEPAAMMCPCGTSWSTHAGEHSTK